MNYMEKAKEMILEDALETAITETRKNIKLKRLAIVQAVIIVALAFKLIF